MVHLKTFSWFYLFLRKENKHGAKEAKNYNANEQPEKVF